MALRVLQVLRRRVLMASLMLILGCVLFCVVFFFQAEDGIRDVAVTGVQTCALPISCLHLTGRTRSAAFSARKMEACTGRKCCFTTKTPAQLTWRSIRAIRRRFTPRCGRRAVPRGDRKSVV